MIFQVTDFPLYTPIFYIFYDELVSVLNLKNHNKDMFILKTKRQNMGSSFPAYPPPSPDSPSLFLGVHFPKQQEFIKP